MRRQPDARLERLEPRGRRGRRGRHARRRRCKRHRKCWRRGRHAQRGRCERRGKCWRRGRRPRREESRPRRQERCDPCHGRCLNLIAAGRRHLNRRHLRSRRPLRGCPLGRLRQDALDVAEGLGVQPPRCHIVLVAGRLGVECAIAVDPPHEHGQVAARPAPLVRGAPQLHRRARNHRIVRGCRRGGPAAHSWRGGPALRCPAPRCWRGGPATRRRRSGPGPHRRRGPAVHMPKRLGWHDHREWPHRLAAKVMRCRRGALRPGTARRRLAPSATAAGPSTTTAASTTRGRKAATAAAAALPAQCPRRHALRQVVPALLAVVVAHEVQQVVLGELDRGAAIPGQG